MDLEALIARLDGTDGVFGVNGGDAVCKEAAALLRFQADIIAAGSGPDVEARAGFGAASPKDSLPAGEAGVLGAAGAPKRHAPKDGATVVEGPLVGMDVILSDRDVWKKRALDAEQKVRKLSDAGVVRAIVERAEVHSIVVTGNEPYGGVTMVIDRGVSFEDRYVCVEIPEPLIGGFVEALAKVAARPPREEQQ